jgi:hypothetical protein
MTVTNPVWSLEAKRRDAEPPLPWSRQPSASPELLQPARLLADHADFIATLGCNQQSKRLRQRGAEQHLAVFADLVAWMGRPTPARVAEARRFGSWRFLSWCFVTGRLLPDAELLAAKGRGAHFTTWAAFYRQDVERATAAARSLGWCDEWIGQVAGSGLALVCLTRGIVLEQITDEELRAVDQAIESSPVLPEVTRRHLHSRLYGLSVLAYQLGLLPCPLCGM